MGGSTITTSIQCICCSTIKKEGEFFLNKNSVIYKSYGKRIPVCKNCLQNIYEENASKYDEQTALKFCCAILDMPYSAETYASTMSRYNELNIGVYVGQMQMKQLKNKTFLNSLLDGSISKSGGSNKEVIESHWSDSDKQNMDIAFPRLVMIRLIIVECQMMIGNIVLIFYLHIVKFRVSKTMVIKCKLVFRCANASFKFVKLMKR